MTEALQNSASHLALLELPEREKDVLHELGRHQDARVAFQGLRRRLGLHPQALTRALRSLERSGLVQHDERGYFVLPAGREAAASHPMPALALRPVFAALLPSHVDSRHLAEQLSRRWFQGLRWYGITEHTGEFVLHWILESDASNVRLRITPRALGLELEAPNNQSPLPFEAAAPLMQAIAAYYGRGAKRVKSDLPQVAG